ncbi:MAG: proline--tRNA ligase [Candidatus Shikimatogenerans bostrichidophilus]|nr:MAG: proline--tRNA ligase [Candidatus Shikimatogenerans bostrichidophilus]
MEDKKYIKLITSTEIAEYSNIKGFMILKPYGYKIWENIKKIINKMLIKNKYKNVNFPLLIPKNLFDLENKYIKTFSKECAIVTHTKLIVNKNNELIIDKNSKLNEVLIIRPTSETIIWNTFNKWIKSYRDLPILINQWCNIIRIEMRNKMLIRNSEFFWQEGHSAHINEKDALLEINKIKLLYKKLIKYYLSIPYISGYKTNKEKFSGAKFTYTFETITKNKGKFIQLATIHFLSKIFSKAFNVKYINKNNIEKYPYGTSCGISTRLIGALIMVHNDDHGLLLPPKIAPIQVIIIPIISNIKKKKKIINFIKFIKNNLKKKKIKVKYDNTSKTPGYKFYKYENMGVPIRITIGKNEINKNIIEITRRDTFKKKYLYLKKNLNKKILNILNRIQKNLYKIAKNNINKKTYKIDNYNEFKNRISTNCGLILSHWDNNTKTELKIQKETRATIRCIPIQKKFKEIGKCIYSGKKSNQRVVFGKSY